MWESAEVSERIYQAGCDPFPELKTESPVQVRGIPWHTRPRTQTQLCFQVFRRQRSPLLHLGWAGVGASFPSCSSHSVRAATQAASDEPIGQQQRCQHAAHSLLRGWETNPIYFILHIKGLKCSTVIWGRRLLAQSICQEDHTACYQINAGHMEDRRSGTTSKQTRRCVPILW